MTGSVIYFYATFLWLPKRKRERERFYFPIFTTEMFLPVAHVMLFLTVATSVHLNYPFFSATLLCMN